MKKNMILAVTISAALSFFPCVLFSVVYEDSSVSIKRIALLSLKVNGSPAQGYVFSLRGASDNLEREFMRYNAAEGYLFQGRKKNIALFRKGQVRRFGLLLRKESGATAVCLDSLEDISGQAAAPLPVETGGIEPPPGAKCILNLMRGAGKDGTVQAIYSSENGVASIFEHFNSQFREKGWVVSWSRFTGPGQGSIIGSRGAEWCFAVFSPGICVFSYARDWRKSEK